MQQIIVKSVISGTVAALAMMPFGFFFRSFGLRVGFYGPKFAALYVSDPGPIALFIQHMVLGWISAVPVVIALVFGPTRLHPLTVGGAYGVIYYVAINSLALPIYFGDTLPWALGVAAIIPSLVIHIVFGLVTAAVCNRLLGKRNAT